MSRKLWVSCLCSLESIHREVAPLPLVHRPGEGLYDSGSDILGVLIPRATGMSLEDFLRQRIFAPLAMHDTSFSVPVSKLNRLASSYWTNPSTGEFEIFDGVEDSRWVSPPVFESGAGGLVSTVDDLLAFGEMMLKRGITAASASYPGRRLS
jgi:CubicO group peptidase (beta-lactamase class C family)